MAKTKDGYKKTWVRQGYDSAYSKLLPLSQEMESSRRIVEDTVASFIKKGVAVRNGELLRVMPEQFTACPMGEVNGVLHQWNGKCYVPMDRDTFNVFVYDFMRRCNVQAEAFNSLELIQTKCYESVMSRKLKPDMSKFTFNNGVLDLKTKTFVRDFNPEICTLSAVDYDYAPCDPIQWRKFLNTVLPDVAAQELLQMFLGAVLIPRSEAKIENMLVLFGSGSNGKSVIFDTVKGVLGENNVTNFGINELVKSNDRKMNLAKMNGKRLNYCSEIRAYLGDDACDDMLKTLISGEPVEARENYGKNFTARDIPLMMANTNWDIQDIDMSYALRRRLVQINFVVTIADGSQDKLLAKRLKEEYAGIFEWMYIGMEMMRAREYRLPVNGLAEPDKAHAIAIMNKRHFSDLRDVIYAYLRHNRFTYRKSRDNTKKFGVGIQIFYEKIKEFMERNGYMVEKINRNMVRSVFVEELHGDITRHGGRDYIRLWCRPDNNKRNPGWQRSKAEMEAKTPYEQMQESQEVKQENNEQQEEQAD